jgi:hypothetical protein
MKPERGQLVQIRFTNGVFFDAIVEDWSDQKSVVRLTDSGDIVIIQKTIQDVMLVKIMTKKEETLQSPAPQEPNVFLGKVGSHIPDYEPFVIKNEVEDEFEQLTNQAITPDSLERITELKAEMNRLDRAELIGNIGKFKPNGIKKVNYESTGYLPVSGTAQHTNQEAPSTDSEFDSELQDLFG